MRTTTLTLIFAGILVASSFLLVAAVALLAAGCSHAPLPPAGMIAGADMPDRLYCVEKDDSNHCVVYRSAQPTEAQLLAMRDKLGLKSVIKLNSAIEGRDHVPDGVDLYDHLWLPAGPVDHDDTAYALDDLESATRPVLVHCTHGINRTGLLIALYRVKHGSIAYAAHAEWVAYGQNDTAFPLLLRAFERETGWSP